MGDHNPRNPPVSQLTPLARSNSGSALTTRHGKLELSGRTAIMGILNLTPDSFYDGGSHGDVDKAIRDGVAMADGGADIIILI